MKNLLCLFVLISLHLSVFSQHSNIMISDRDAPEEPSICINPLNTNEIVAGANIWKTYRSTDGGLHWTYEQVSSDFGVWGDPCIVCDNKGSFYFFHLSNPRQGDWLDRIVCQKINKIDEEWSNGSFMGLNQDKDQDKEWTCIDRSTNYMYTTWTQFDKYGSNDPIDESNIMFSRSTDGGLHWEATKMINETSGDCLDDDKTVEGAVPAVGPNGEVYVSWIGPEGLVFDRSTDHGDNWMEEDIIVCRVPGGWTFNVPGISRCNGLPVTVCDTSKSAFRGNIYINWSDQRNGTDDTDVWFVRSNDGGDTWTEPFRVNDDPPGTHQFFTWMTVDQSNGYIYMVFYDRRNYLNNLTDVYMAVSKDGGESFDNFRISESPFNPNSSVFFGDYTNISAHNDVVRPIWTRLDDHNLSVWTAIIDTETTGIDQSEIPGLRLDQNYPNPFTGQTSISYALKKDSEVSLAVFDSMGNQVYQIINHEKRYAGNHTVTFSLAHYHLPVGYYFYKLMTPEEIISKKMLYIK